MFQSRDTKDVKTAIWFSSILRWVLGALFIALGIIFLEQDRSAWILIGFGGIMVITGFIRPRRCINDRCDV